LENNRTGIKNKGFLVPVSLVLARKNITMILYSLL